jgi:hypothetical protein
VAEHWVINASPTILQAKVGLIQDVPQQAKVVAQNTGITGRRGKINLSLR